MWLEICLLTMVFATLFSEEVAVQQIQQGVDLAVLPVWPVLSVCTGCKTGQKQDFHSLFKAFLTYADTQGALRVSCFNPFEGWVGSESVGQDILISGRIDMNRCVKSTLSG